MKIALIVSTQDPAGMNMRECLLHDYPFVPAGFEYDGIDVFSYKGNSPCDVKLYCTLNDSIYTENIDTEIECDFLLYITKHESKNKVHSLTCHTQGNWGEAPLGGKAKNVGIAPARVLTECFFQQLKGATEAGLLEVFDITLECTHHGPEINVPSIFIEIGSDMDQWKDVTAGRLNAKVIIDLIERIIPNPPEKEVAIGIGGLHYCQNFVSLMKKTEIAFGHIIPKYMLESLSVDILLHAIERTHENVNYIIVDWKGVGPHKERIKAACDAVSEKTGIPWMKIKEFKKHRGLE